MFVITLALLAACGGLEGETPRPPDEALLRAALDVADPEPFVDLVDNPFDVLPYEDGCPSIEVQGALETWTGGCALADGTIIEGTLSRYDGDEGSWISASGFAVRTGAETLLSLDGAIELQSEGDLVFLDAAASVCGLDVLDCADGPVTVDLAFTLFPLVSWPYTYDATVSGVVALPGQAPADVEGSWSRDEASCASEPSNGLFAVRGLAHHTLEWDGAKSCDGCASWSVQGIDAGRFCSVGD